MRTLVAVDAEIFNALVGRLGSKLFRPAVAVVAFCFAFVVFRAAFKRHVLAVSLRV